MTTKELTDYIISVLPWVTLRRNNTGRRGKYLYGIRNWPDLIGYDGSGRFWAIEIKNKDTGDKIRGRQDEEMAAMRIFGCVVFVVRCKEDADELSQMQWANLGT